MTSTNHSSWRRVALLASLAIAAMIFIYGCSTTRQNASLTHDTRAVTDADAVLRVVNAYGLPVAVEVKTVDGDTQVFWPVGPGSDHLVIEGRSAAVSVRVTTFTFHKDVAAKGVHRFTAVANESDTMVLDAEGAMQIVPGPAGRAEHHAFDVQAAPERTSRAWSWTEADRNNRVIYSSENGVGFSVGSAFLPGTDVTITWEVAGVAASRSKQMLLAPGASEEVIIDRDGEWSHRTPGALRGWWMRR